MKKLYQLNLLKNILVTNNVFCFYENNVKDNINTKLKKKIKNVFLKKIKNNIFSSNVLVLYNIDSIIFNMKLNNVLCVLLKSKNGLLYIFSKHKYKSILLYLNNKVYFNPFFNIVETFPKWLQLKTLNK